MRKHVIRWSGIGLWCAALGSAAIAQDTATPEAATLEPSLTTSTSSFAIRARERQKDPEQRRLLRANSRQSIEQEHALLDQVLPLDANTRSKLLELLTDLRMEAGDRYANAPRGLQIGRSFPSMEALDAAMERERFTDNELQRSANQATRDRQRIRDVLGESRFQRYVDYEITLFQRKQVGYFDAQLPAEDKLDPSQRERLILLLSERRRQEDEARQLNTARINGESARRGYPSTPTGGDHTLRELWFYEQNVQLVEASSKLLLTQLADLLTPRQLAVYEANEAKSVAQEIQTLKRMRKRAGVDIEKPVSLESAPVVPSRTPLAGRVRLEVSFKVNENAITQQSLLADNGGQVTFEIAPLIVEAVPVLFEDGWRELTLKFYESDGRGGRRRVVPNTWGAGVMAGADPVQKVDALAMWACRGYAIIGNLTLSAVAQ